MALEFIIHINALDLEAVVITDIALCAAPIYLKITRNVILRQDEIKFTQRIIQFRQKLLWIKSTVHVFLHILRRIHMTEGIIKDLPTEVDKDFQFSGGY